MLSKSVGEEGQLYRLDLRGRAFERFIEPLPEVAIGKQIEAKHRHQVGHGPGEGGPEFEDFQE